MGRQGGISWSTGLLRVVCLAVVLLSGGQLLAAERWHGVSVFGPEGLKYKPGEPFEYLNPDAPIAGRLRVVGRTFSKIMPFGLTGSTVQELELHCFEALGIKSWDDDEAYSVYGLLAESFELADDRSSLTVRLRPEARFSDGEPVTADDVIFSYELLFDPDMNPALRLHLKHIKGMVKVDAHTVRVDFKQFSRDLPIYVCRIVIFPKHVYGEPGINLGEDFREAYPVGSGPYRVKSHVMGERICYERRDDYWGRDLPYCKGYLNWKEIEYQVFYDVFSQYEALKSGLIDYKCHFQPDVLQRLDGEDYRHGYLKRAYFPITRPTAMKCLAFNLRRPMWQDIELRKVLVSLYDFDYINRNFSYGESIRLVSYFHNQPQLRAAPGPATGRVRTILEELAATHNTDTDIFVPAAALARGPYEMGTDSAGKRLPIETRVHAACRRLDELGWRWNAAEKVRMKDGRKLVLEMFIGGSDMFHYTEVCKMAGINAKLTELSGLERQNRVRNFAFDGMGGWYAGNKAPGGALARYFLSSEADVRGSKNMMGLKNPAVDDVLDVISRSTDRDTVQTYAKVFDRIMCSNWYVIPRYWPTRDHGVFANYLRGPEKYATGLWTHYNIWWYWWFDQERYDAIQAARKQGVAVTFDDVTPVAEGGTLNSEL